MSFTAYWKPTTGFNVTDYPVKIGKQLNQCTAEELLAHPMCGSVSLFANIAYMVKSTDLGYGSVAMHLTGGAQWKEPIVGSQSATWLCEVANSGDSAKIYRRTIFVAWKSNVTMPQYSIDDTCNNEIYIVEDIKDPNKLVYNTTGQSDLGHGDGAAITARLGALPLKHTCQKGQSAWSSAPSQVQYEDPDTLVVTNYNIGLVFAYVIGSEVFLCCKDHLGKFGGRYQNDTNRYNFLSGGSDYKSFISDNDYRLYLGQNVNDLNREATLGEIWSDCYPDPIPNPATFSNGNIYYATPNTILPYQIEFRYTMQNSTISGYLASRSMYIGLSATTALEARKQQIARAGVYFVHDGELLKPIIQNGIVINYDTPEQPSEIDDYTDLNHPVPTTPGGGGGGGGGDDDDIDDHEMGAGTGLGGMCNLWLLTAQQLADLHSAFSSAPVGFEPLNSIISVMGLGVAPTYVTSDIEYITPINIRLSDGTTWQTGVEGHIVASQESGFQFTNIEVNRKYNNFLDFSPYATHEIFLPMCGWLTLPDIAVDRTMTVTYLPDIESLKCRAVVSVVDNSGDRCVIGEKDGIMGAEIPITNTGHSLFVGDAIVNGASIAGEVITGAIGAGFTKMNAQGGSYRPYEGFTVGMGGTLPGAIANAFVSGNVNRTHYLTGNGTRVGFSDGSKIQIKSIYHMVDKPKNYDHTVGKVCNKTGELSDFSGFTVCENPHINFSALEAEKEEIKRLLEQGVIL